VQNIAQVFGGAHMTAETDEMQAPDEEYKWGFSKPENDIF
jgi:hypothetical protein